MSETSSNKNSKRWSQSEVTLLNKFIRQGTDTREIIKAFPDRTEGGILYKKYAIENNISRRKHKLSNQLSNSPTSQTVFINPDETVTVSLPREFANSMLPALNQHLEELKEKMAGINRLISNIKNGGFTKELSNLQKTGLNSSQEKTTRSTPRTKKNKSHLKNTTAHRPKSRKKNGPLFPGLLNKMADTIKSEQKPLNINEMVTLIGPDFSVPKKGKKTKRLISSMAALLNQYSKPSKMTKDGLAFNRSKEDNVFFYTLR